MSDQNQQFASGGQPLGGGTPERPACPTCQRRMDVKQVSPVLFATDLDDVVYGCERCSTEAKRTVKRT